MTKGGRTQAGDSAEAGSVHVARSFWDDPDLDPKQPFTEREAFLWLVTEAVRTSTVITSPGGQLTLKPGEFGIPQSVLAQRWRWSQSTVHRFLLKLKNAGRLDLIRQVETWSNGNSGTWPAVFFIRGYQAFMTPPISGVNNAPVPVLNNGQAGKVFPPKNPLFKKQNSINSVSRSPVDSKKLESEDSQPVEVTRASEPSPSKGRTFLPAGFQPDLSAAVAYWTRRGRDDLVPFVGDEVENFRAHHTSRNSRSASWPASWRTWYVRAPAMNPVSRQRSGAPAAPRHKIISLIEAESKHGPH